MSSFGGLMGTGEKQRAVYVFIFSSSPSFKRAVSSLERNHDNCSSRTAVSDEKKNCSLGYDLKISNSNFCRAIIDGLLQLENLFLRKCALVRVDYLKQKWTTCVNHCVITVNSLPVSQELQLEKLEN